MGCLRCGKNFICKPDSPKRPHDIPYGKSGQAMFPLCEECWSKENTEGRKRYASRLLFIWFRDGCSIREIIKIEKQVHKRIEKEES